MTDRTAAMAEALDLPENPHAILYRICGEKNPWETALGYARKLLSLTEPEKKNFWYKAELNLLTLILMYVGRAEAFIPLMPAGRNLERPVSALERTPDEVACYMRSPFILRENVEHSMLKSCADENLLRGCCDAWLSASQPVARNVAANLAVEAEIFEYLLCRQDEEN